MATKGTEQASTCDLEGLPNLGPKSRTALEAAGIDSIGALRRLGSVAAYARAKRVSKNVSLNLLWALEGALTGLSWLDVARDHRTTLLLALEDHERRQSGDSDGVR